MCIRDRDIRGSRNALPADFRAVINYMKEGNCPVEELISKIAKPEGALEAMQEWTANPGKVFRILVELDVYKRQVLFPVGLIR